MFFVSSSNNEWKQKQNLNSACSNSSYISRTVLIHVTQLYKRIEILISKELFQMVLLLQFGSGTKIFQNRERLESELVDIQIKLLS